MTPEEARQLVKEWKALTPEQEKEWEGYDRCVQIIHCTVCRKTVESSISMRTLEDWLERGNLHLMEKTEPCYQCAIKRDRRQYLKDYGPDE